MSALSGVLVIFPSNLSRSRSIQAGVVMIISLSSLNFGDDCDFAFEINVQRDFHGIKPPGSVGVGMAGVGPAVWKGRCTM